MSIRLAESLAATDAMARVFSDASVLQAMLDFEAALARAEAASGVIPEEAADAIREAARADAFDVAELTRLALRAGTPAIPIVKALKERVGGRNAGFVHWGATSQDVVDTAVVLLLRKCHKTLFADHERVERSLRRLSEEHAHTVMLGRTLLQAAPPVTFGLKAAGWLGSLRRGWARVESRFEESQYLQFGGASGTLAALGDRGIAVSDALANELGLRCPDAPWHTHRDRIAALLAALSIYTASLGKMALDIALLMQGEVGEAAEPGGDGRGVSSAMPQKHNPTACMLTVAAARRAPGLLANFLNGMLQEQERAVGGWQAEWESVEGIVQAAAVAVESMAEVTEGLHVNPARMKSNLKSAGSAVFAEKAVMVLAETMGKDEARQVVEESLRKTRGLPDLKGIDSPEDYLGSAEAFRVRLLEGK
jgi:3-carboxy-cis,cis-muconate cycloisomerase